MTKTKSISDISPFSLFLASLFLAFIFCICMMRVSNHYTDQVGELKIGSVFSFFSRMKNQIAHNTCVLTGTISPHANVAGSLNISYSHTIDAKAREKEYYYAIKYYIEHTDFSVIIFCDNSNYNFSYKEELYNLAKKLGKTLELLKFQGDIYLSTKISYGAGEAEIFDYIYDNSKYLHQVQSWYKVTGRYIIENINEIIKKTNEFECYFNKYGIRTTPFHIATSFFKISNKIYKKYLYQKQIPVFLLIRESDNTMLQLEQVWYILLREYILNEYIYMNIPNIPVIISHMMFNQNKFLLLIFKICVMLGLLDFNRCYKAIDPLFLSNAKKDIIKKLGILNNDKS